MGWATQVKDRKLLIRVTDAFINKTKPSFWVVSYQDHC